jgi:homoserine O-acetyltransferase
MKALSSSLSNTPPPQIRSRQQQQRISPLSTTAATIAAKSSIPKSTNKSTATAATTFRSKSTTTSSGGAAMDDEYGNMESSGKIYTHPQPYHLESFGLFGHHIPASRGHPSSSPPRGVLNPAFINYNTYGTLNATRDNVLVICHALTGNSSLEAWWGELLGPGKAFDTDRYFIVCCNILGSCYGSCGPSTLRPGMMNNNDDNNRSSNNDDGGESYVPRNKDNQAIYGIDFPDVSVRDTVRLQLLMLKNELKINSIKCVIGGSFGGMQTMEYCVMAGATRPEMGGQRMMMGCGGAVMVPKAEPAVVPYGLGEFTTKRNGRIEPFVRSAVPIACGARHTAWQIAISETQRQAVYADPKWNNGRIDPHDPPNAGLSVARQIGMFSYRTPLGYDKKFGRALTDESGPSYGSRAPWQVKSYLEYQGKKFLDRFDPVTYVKLTEQMDSHDVSRGRGTMEEVLSHVEIPVCVLGIDSDVLYPLQEQEEIANGLPNGELKIIHSDAGHDGFLLEQDQVAAHIKSFLYSHD